ncbi:polyphosphate polymerase domain-containing protein [Streptococcus suis]|uniref:Polyphosphate polymerase domain-containing protein n=1 Tax=Streptococcus suis TaxID=1307 RepID=A0A4T2GK15_STRSU|nr:polyphosphate polymerase domain-containing protein [Streptococcus suis]MBM7270035.1 polyphosphate polymerase domain-containing protein [Streptococcus suis]TIH99288.1 polyphosphate polymerase domain-containing protein [Streptococcus suis]
MSKKVETKFKRIETKYILDCKQLAAVLDDFKNHLVEDDYPTSTISNIYFDTPSYQMIQDSAERLWKREKIRMRTYDAYPTEDSQVFLEIKKKENGVGLKDRLTSRPKSVLDFIHHSIVDETITNPTLLETMAELRARYGKIEPMMYIYYDRFSMKGIEDKKVRVTIDQNILYRPYDVSLFAGKYGYPLLDENQVIMEIKVPEVYPTWLQAIIDKYGLERVSFSKYGTAHTKLVEELAEEKLVERAVV